MQEDSEHRRDPSRPPRTLWRRDDGQLSYASDDGSDVLISPEEIVCILGRASGHVLVRLEERPDDAEAPYLLHTHTTDEVDQELLERHLLRDVPPFLKPENELHIVVSTKSGVGLALKFWEAVLRPLLTLLSPDGHVADQGPEEAQGRHLLVTQTAQSVREFARSRWTKKHPANSNGNTSPPAQETIILLSGDGGVVDLLNGSDEDSHAVPATPASLPTLALLPLGTANALFHSLHKPLYSAHGANANPPSPLVLALRTLIRGRPAPLPTFRADFTPGSRLVSYSPKETPGPEGADGPGIERRDTAVSHLYGAIVASHGFHAQLVWESDTPEYRRHGAKRFGMVAAELLRESHAYRADVRTSLADQAGPSASETAAASAPGDAPSFNYILATMVSNLERTFTISPASRPLENDLRLVRFGDVGGARTMEIMQAAYDDGKHVDMPDVGYERVAGVSVRILEEDARWRKVCVDGTIVEIPQGGEMRVRKVAGALFGVLVDEAVLPS